MGWHQFLGLFCFLFFLHSQLPFTSSLCPPDQRDTLLNFKKSFILDEIVIHSDLACGFTRDISWNKSVDCCSWDKVTCDKVTGNAIGLHLSSYQIHGTLYSNNSLLLPKLQVLEMSNCYLTKFPYFLNSLERLTHLDLSLNRISGEIPRCFWGISRHTLEHLDLSGNFLDGGIHQLHWKRLSYINLQENSLQGPLLIPSPSTRYFYASNNGFTEIPSSICQLSSLLELELFNNNLSRMLPPCFGNITNLELLDLGSNKLQGPLSILSPSTRYFYAISICQLSSLLELDLSNNNLLGTVPPCFGNITNLEVLDLSSNKLQGPLPIPSPSTRSFHAMNNDFTGEIPSLICQLSSLWSLDLSNNSLLGNIPPSFGNITNLVDLGLTSNKLQGSLPRPNLYISNNNFIGWWPTKIFSNMSLQVIDLSNNKFGGPIPLPSIVTMYYSIANNVITGKIPSLICNATNLGMINLSNNRLIGSLPRCSTNFGPIVEVLNLGMNHFEGTIPQSISSIHGLRTLDLSGNRFEGTLPRSLVNCTYLQVLDLSSNQIEDTFPRWLGKLPELKILILRSNNFKGLLNIPKGDLIFPKLRILDLSNNNFSGPLSTNLIMNLRGMKNREVGQDEPLYMTRFIMLTRKESYENTVTVMMKGQEIRLVKILTIFTTIDLSQNFFQGDIPEAFGYLLLLVGLNLSHNHLIGSIPLTLGNLTNLGWLDLSSNMLSGEIPRVLGDLASLGYLNLSKNQLIGRIPQDKQLSTFSNNSFTCPGDAQPPPPSSSTPFDHERHESWLKKKVVWIGYASGIVIGISIAYIAFEIGRPEWLTRGVRMLERSAAQWMEKPERKAIKFHGQ
ncbi:hypothetical protein EUGRSUZ_H00985 [Eucalyptus grandis]|uniref:Uncharacterized protein n=2 Tax=Eucalyptus grandis TaxID=71139 RepID=A0ACC3KC08_EUCGR|nr:hypothetical protein EUGRSUZ_H00985 [Eucalyptus grandis]